VNRGNVEVNAPGVAIVTDSISDVPNDILAKLNIHLVPVTIHFGLEEFKDRVEMSMKEFMARLVSTREPVKTSQPSPGEFAEVFHRAGAGGRAVVSIQPSPKLSGTYQSACIARDLVAAEGRRVEVVNTNTGSMGQGWAVIEAARAALAGLPVEQIVERARAVSARVKLLLTIDTLEYLQRSGRLGSLQALVGSLLKVKPIITVRDGQLTLADVAFRPDRLIERLTLNFRRSVAEGARVALAVGHAACRERAEELLEEMSRFYEIVESMLFETGPGIAANTGPGAFGAMLYEVD